MHDLDRLVLELDAAEWSSMLVDLRLGANVHEPRTAVCSTLRVVAEPSDRQWQLLLWLT